LSEGAAEIGFALRAGTTRLGHLYQHDPLRVLFPAPASGDPCLAVIVVTAGGFVGGDRLRVAVDLEAGTRAHVTASAAEKVYRSKGAVVGVAQELAVGAGASLEFLPPETILFEDARLRRATVVDVADGGAFLGGGILVFGRRARGERFTRGLLHEVWEVRRAGRLVWGDALALDGDIAATIADPACLDGAAATASLVLVPPDGGARELLDDARLVVEASSGADMRGGVTVVAGILVARFLARDALRLRRAYADLACHLRAAAMGLPPFLPRLWHV
jgi:urease accessory protein